MCFRVHFTHLSMTGHIMTKVLLRHPFRTITSLSANRKLVPGFLVDVNTFHFKAAKDINNSIRWFVNSTTRQFSNRSSSEVIGPKTLERFRIRDGVPKSYELIYRADYPNYLLASQTLVFLALGSVVFGTALYFMEEELTAEQKRKQIEDKVEFTLAEKARKTEESDMLKLVQEFKREQNVKESLAAPALEDIVEVERPHILALTTAFIGLAAALFKLQRMLPVRVYTNEKTKHCIAVLYGHIIPGKLTWHEFLAGTLKRSGQGIFGPRNEVIYKDGGGKNLILLDHFFRSPKDYNFVLGYDAEDAHERSRRTKK